MRIVKNPAERREEIVEAACGLFLAKGYDRTTMKDVMGELGIAKGTIYHYFRSKEALLDAVLETLVEAELRRKVRLLDNCGESVLERIRQLVASSVVGEHDPSFLEHLHQPANAGMHIRLLARRISAEAALYGELIARGCAEGIFRTAAPLECAEFLLAGIRFLTDLGIYPWQQEELRRRIAAFPALVEAQLGAAPGSFAFLGEVLA